MTDHRDKDGRIEETANEARQGPKGRRVAWVLAGGLVLAVLGLIYFLSTDIENPPPSLGVTPGETPSTDSVPNNTAPSRLDAPPPTNPQQ